MAQQIINIGSTPNDGTGTTLRVGGQYINENFTELYSGYISYTSKNTDYTAVLTDIFIECTATLNLTLPTAVGNVGKKFIVGCTSGTTTVKTTSNQKINGETTQILTQNDTMQVVSNGTGWIII